MHRYIWVGLDVHKATIAVAVTKGEEAPRSLGTIPNDPDAIAKLMRKLGPLAHLRVCYEAGPCGPPLYLPPPPPGGPPPPVPPPPPPPAGKTPPPGRSE